MPPLQCVWLQCQQAHHDRDEAKQTYFAALKAYDQARKGAQPPSSIPEHGPAIPARAACLSTVQLLPAGQALHAAPQVVRLQQRTHSCPWKRLSRGCTSSAPPSASTSATQIAGAVLFHPAWCLLPLPAGSSQSCLGLFSCKCKWRHGMLPTQTCGLPQCTEGRVTKQRPVPAALCLSTMKDGMPHVHPAH